MEICLGNKRFRTLVNLKDRRRLKDPFLLGRAALEDRFLVDLTKEFTRVIECEE